jgi:MFS family permease
MSQNEQLEPEQAPQTTPEANPTPSEPAKTEAVTVSPAEMRKNYNLGVINGVLFGIGDSFSNANLVLSLLIRQLGGSLALVGLLPALQTGGYLIPQMIVSGRLQAMPYKLFLYRRAAVARMIIWLILTGMVFASNWLSNTVSLWLFVICYMIFNIGGGTSTLAFQDVVAKVVPPRRRGSFYGNRQLYSGLLTVILVGPLIQWLLSDNSPIHSPYNFGVLCLLSFVFYVPGLYAFSIIKEPRQENLGAPISMLDGLRRAPVIMRENQNYRLFIIARMITRVGQIAEPFYLIYATESLGLSAGVAGIFISLRAIAGALSNLLWGPLSARKGNRTLMIISGVMMIITPALALVGPILVHSLGLGSLSMTIALGVMFLISGAAADGSNIGNSTYLLEIVPENERPTYVGLANTTLGIVTFLPIIGGWLVSMVGYEGTFIISIVFAIFGLIATYRLSEPMQNRAAAK